MNDQHNDSQGVGLLAEGMSSTRTDGLTHLLRGEAQSVGLFTRFRNNPILTREALPYPSSAIFNPAAVSFGGETVLLARVEDMRGISHLALCRSKDGVTNWTVAPAPALVPDPVNYPEEQWGFHDPRVSWIEERKEFAVVYTTHSRWGPQVSLATTKDFKKFDRWGSILPPGHRDAALFPRRFDGRMAILHRSVIEGRDSSIWIAFSNDLGHWGDHRLLLESRQGPWWDAHHVGLCPPPMETPEGWLVLFYGTGHLAGGHPLRLGLALLDLEDPRRVLHRSQEWVFGPQETYERDGHKRGVIFPCGWLHDASDGKIRLYYGAGRSSVCLADANFKEVLDYALSCPRPSE